MNKTLLLLLLSIFVFSQNISAQYTFSTCTGTYTELTGATSLNNGIAWQDGAFLLPLGFDFVLYGNTYNQFYLNGNGNGHATLSPVAGTTGTIPYIVLSTLDIMDRGGVPDSSPPAGTSLSNISYKLEGVTGSQILKLEFNNVGFYPEISPDGVSSDFMNYQVWLYEGSNNIEMHFGSSSITRPDLIYNLLGAGDLVGIYNINYDAGTFVGDAYTLSGDADSPIMNTINSFVDITYLNPGSPSSGTIYKFTTPTVPVELVRFEGENKESGNYLTWETASEINNKGFSVERSFNGVNFSEIDFIQGENRAAHYSFLDEDVSRRVYYRLKQIDLDGSFEYSNIIALSGKSNLYSFSIFPNPVKDFISIQLNGGIKGEIHIMDITGRILFSENISDLSSTILVEESSLLSDGVYFLQIRDGSGNIQTQKFIKQ